MPDNESTPCNAQKEFSRIQLRRGYEADFSAINTILASGEPAYAIDAHKFKIGDGIKGWNELSSFVDEVGVSGIVMNILENLNIII